MEGPFSAWFGVRFVMKSWMAALVGKMSFLLCTIFLKSVLISRSPQRFVLRTGAVSFQLTSGGARSDCSMQAGAQNQWDV
jgi:hypothetical protein